LLFDFFTDISQLHSELTKANYRAQFFMLTWIPCILTVAQRISLRSERRKQFQMYLSISSHLTCRNVSISMFAIVGLVLQKVKGKSITRRAIASGVLCSVSSNDSNYVFGIPAPKFQYCPSVGFKELIHWRTGSTRDGILSCRRDLGISLESPQVKCIGATNDKYLKRTRF